MKIFGPVYSQYEKQGQKAVDFLMKKKKGEIPNALFHESIGWIDLVWGYAGTGKSDGYGLSKIAKYHPSVIKNLAENLAAMDVTQQSSNRLKLESEKHFAVVSLVLFENSKTWLLTMFEKHTK